LKARFDAAWTQHGGSGLSITWSDLDDLDVDEFQDLLAMIGERRKREASELKRSARAGRR